MTIVFHIADDEIAFDDEVIPRVGDRIEASHHPGTWRVTSVEWRVHREHGVDAVHIYTDKLTE